MGSGFSSLLNGQSGQATSAQGQTINTLLAAIAASFGSAGGQILVFLLLRVRLSRIYQPKSFLVPERERVGAPPRGIIQWLSPVFLTSNLEFIHKCGLDAYFFLRYLRMLLKIFLPMAIIILPILLPINRYSGPNGASGLDLLSISNVRRAVQSHRLWAHLILAVAVIMWVCYVTYKEMRGYISVRQAYLTSPQHRIRASATTVLVTGIPKKWLTVEALNGLYDVFPGGIRNIWINRNFDALSGKVSTRDGIALDLEAAETNLIKMCRKAHLKKVEEEEKKSGMKGKSKEQKKMDQIQQDQAADRMAEGNGTSAGDEHRAQTMHERLHEIDEEEEERHNSPKAGRHRPANPLQFVNQGFGALGQGLKGFGTVGTKVLNDVTQGMTGAVQGVDHTFDQVNAGTGFMSDEELYRRSHMSSDSDVPPTPPPKQMKSTPLRQSVNMDHGYSQQFSDFEIRPQSRGTVSMDLAHDSPRPANGRDISDEKTPSMRLTRPSGDTKPKDSLQIEEPIAHVEAPKNWQFWKGDHDRALRMPSPMPHVADEGEFPFHSNAADTSNQGMSRSKLLEKFMFWKKSGGVQNEAQQEPYPSAYDENYDENKDEHEPRWRKYIEPQDRETLRTPIVNQSWFPRLPFLGQKIDKIDYLRRELARLNLEIEHDQDNVDKYPYMNSAFIQFNNQVAAHMACQSLSHHVPQQMAPRLVEIDPNDILWSNMSIKWWERYVRTVIVFAIAVGVLILYTVPVTFSGLLSKVNVLGSDYPWLGWLTTLPQTAIAIIQGVLPPVLLSVILTLVPIIFGLLVKFQGVPTGNARQLGIQDWYFAFLFIQVFLVVSLSTGLTTFFSSVSSNPTSVFQTLATSLPKAATYFFSYLLIQSLGNSASALLQLTPLLIWFLWAPISDSTARQKFKRQMNLQSVSWGSFFPPFTNFAVIGLVYSIIAPLILVFMILIFALYWIVYRYNVLYVFQFRNDTGGLLFPKAVNQLYTGLYVMELCLIGFFISAEDCVPHLIIMIVALILTVLYQWQLNVTFDPLFQYLPITLEDEAVIRDEQFAKLQDEKFREHGKEPSNRSNDTPKHTVADVLWSGYSDELEDLTPDERDVLVRYSFQHSALRARRPVVWIPRDELGVSDDEVRRSKRFSTVDNGEKGKPKTYIWISNEGTALNSKGKVVYKRPPPDFSNVDLIAL